MKIKKIGQILFCFYKNNEQLYSLTKRTIGLGMLLSRLLNERYKSKPIEFLNLMFLDEESYENDQRKIKGYNAIAGPAMSYYGVLDIEMYLQLAEEDKNALIWKMACEYIIKTAENHSNKDLVDACKYAYETGVSLNYCTDLQGISSELILFGKVIKSEIVFRFEDEKVTAFLILRNEDKVVFDKPLHKTDADVGAFFYVFKEIVSVGNIILIKGPKNASIFPMTVTISAEDLMG
ncbi:hypothetical protein SIO70_26340 [Chitinophaga sancti]|uniref:hypothetical protein n=1 Tax=Chitinophaga sancti TaxID=1004 RepID=UPI002A754C64|nr:hypothetical protein [Chitinophaga sancti]WPQ61885.1 hypothetical protein SIO70_26340 [Chitinophaga sancti]